MKQYLERKLRSSLKFLDDPTHAVLRGLELRGGVTDLVLEWVVL